MSPERPHLSKKAARSHLQEVIQEQSLRETLDDTLEQLETARREVKKEIREHRKNKVLKNEAKLKQQHINKEKARLKKIAEVVKRLEKGKVIKPKNARVYNPQRVIEGEPVKKKLFTVFGQRPTLGISRAKRELREIEKRLKKEKHNKKHDSEYLKAKAYLKALETKPRYERRTLDKELIEESVKRVKEGVYFDPPEGIEIRELQQKNKLTPEEENIKKYFSTRTLLSPAKARHTVTEVLDAYLQEQASLEELEGAVMDYSRAFYVTEKNEPEAYLKMKENTERVLNEIQEALDEEEQEEEEKDVDSGDQTEASESREQRWRWLQAHHKEVKKKRRRNLIGRISGAIAALGALALATTSEVRNHKAETVPEQPTASQTEIEEQRPQEQSQTTTLEESDGEFVPDEELWNGHEHERPAPVPFNEVARGANATDIDEEPLAVTVTPEQLRNDVDRETMSPEELERRNDLLNGKANS